MGWDQFETGIKSGHKNKYLDWISESLIVVEGLIGKPSVYGEFGCPFSGFALLETAGLSRQKRGTIVRELFSKKESGSL